MKICTTCKERKSFEDFHRNKNTKDGFTYRCKSCTRIATKKYYENNREERVAYTREYKIKNPEIVKARKKKYQEENRERIKLYNREWRRINHKRYTVQKRKYAIANREKTKAYFKKWHKANRENQRLRRREYYLANCEEIKSKSMKWYRENPKKVLDQRALRRARKLNASVAPVSRQEIFARDEGVCHICKKKVDENDWHLDHVIPLARNGTHEPDNVAVSHPTCNLRKNVYETVLNPGQ